MCRRITITLAIAIVACSMIPNTPAQIPDGWYIASSFRSASQPGPGGIFLGHPLNPGAAYSVAGLPPQVTGAAWPSAPWGGSDLVLRRPSDGAIITYGWGVTGVPLSLFVLSISGSPSAGFNATALKSINLGTIAAGSQLAVAQAALLSGNRVVICVDKVGVTGQPLSGALLGLVDLNTNVVAPIQASSVPASAGLPNAVAVDENQGVVYLGMFWNNAQSYVYSVPLNGGAGGAATLVASLPFGIRNLALESDGTLVASGSANNPWRGMIYRINASGTFSVPTTVPVIGSLTVEKATGNYLLTEWQTYRVSPTAGTTTPLGFPPPGGWGVLSGIDIDPDPETYGPSTPGASTYTWALAPNPGGLPYVGNTNFSLTIQSSPGGAPGLWAASAARLNPTLVGGIMLNIDPSQVVPIGFLAGTPFETIPLPIPAAPQLSGLQVFFQTVHFAPSGPAATSGLHVTVL